MSVYSPRPILITSLSVPNTYYLTGFCTLPEMIKAEVSDPIFGRVVGQNPLASYELSVDPAGSQRVLILTGNVLSYTNLGELDVQVVNLEGKPYKVTTASSKKQGIVDGLGNGNDVSSINFEEYTPRPFYILDTDDSEGDALRIAGFAMDAYEEDDLSFSYNPVERSIAILSGNTGQSISTQDRTQTTLFYLISEFSFEEGDITLDRAVLKLDGINLTFNDATPVFSPEIVGSNNKEFDNSI